MTKQEIIDLLQNSISRLNLKLKNVDALEALGEYSSDCSLYDYYDDLIYAYRHFKDEIVHLIVLLSQKGGH